MNNPERPEPVDDYCWLHQRGADGASEPPTGYPPIPLAENFQHNYGYQKPREVHGWQWSTTFHAWSALVTFEDGWHGFTWPQT